MTSGAAPLRDVPALPSLDWLAPAAGRSAVRLLAEIHGTVDLDRALVAVGRRAGGTATAPTTFDDDVIGARVVLVPGLQRRSTATPDWLAVAEPSREGRLAAWLARHGEGLAGWYLAADLRTDVLARRADAAGLAVIRSGAGPFGPGTLVVPARRRPLAADPFLIFVDDASVPSRP